MANKNCELCGNIMFSRHNVCVNCKRWGDMLKAFHNRSIKPSSIADHVYEHLVYKTENFDFYDDDELTYDLDEELLNCIKPFTFWGSLYEEN